MEPRAYHDYVDFSESDGQVAEPTLPWRRRVVAALQRPITLALFGIIVIGLLALVHLNQVASIESANAQLSALRDQQARLERQESLLREELGQVTSPAYIDQRARALGLAPGGDAPTFVIREPQP